MVKIKPTVQITIIDVPRGQMRFIEAEWDYVPKCGNGLHQIGSFLAKCACGEVGASHFVELG